MAECQCGCGGETGSEFLPGHDQRLRTNLESRVGGLLALRTLVTSARSYADGESDEGEFLQTVRSVFARR